MTGLLRALLEEGGDLSRPSLHSLPEDLADRVLARLRGLDSADRALLELLTVLGYRAELGDLLRLSGRSLDDLGGGLERLQRVPLVSEIEDGRELVYEIAHPLIQEAIYNQIGGARRRALHRHVARVLVESGRHGAAASHVVQAADPGDDEAIGTLCEALRRAEAGEHHREALTLLEALLTMLPAGDGRWRGVVDVMPLTPEWIVDHRADAAAEVGARAMRRADQVLQRSGDVAHQAAVKFSLGSLLAWGMCELEAGRELIETAQGLFLDAGDQHSALLATNELGYHLAMADDGAGHERAARQVLAMAQSRDDQFLQLQALCSLAWFLGLAGRLEEALGAIEQAILIAEEGDKAYRRSYLLGMKASFRHLLGERRAREELELATEINQAYRDTLNLDFAAQIAWETGELERAVAATVDQMAWDGGVSVRRAFGVAMAVMSLAELGRLDEASELQATLDSAFRGKTSWVLSRLRDWSRAVIVELSGDRRAALEPLRQVTEDALANQYWTWGRWMAADLGESAAFARDPVLAGRAHELLRATRMVRMATPMRDCGPLWPGLRRLPPTTTLRPRLTWPMPRPISSRGLATRTKAVPWLCSVRRWPDRIGLERSNCWSRPRSASSPVTQRSGARRCCPCWPGWAREAVASGPTWWARARSAPASDRWRLWHRRVSWPGRSPSSCSSESAPWRPIWPTSTPSWASLPSWT